MTHPDPCGTFTCEPSIIIISYPFTSFTKETFKRALKAIELPANDLFGSWLAARFGRADDPGCK
jgi:hypothetical protein